MTSGYDEWVTARTPSLLRFAAVLTGSDATAERATRSALARLWSTWETTLRMDDPDLRARDFVVRACPSRQPATAWARAPMPVGAGAHRGPEDQSDDRASVVLDWLAGLPFRRRAVVVLTFLERCSDREIAEVLGLTEASVPGQRARALATLPPDLPASTRDETVRAVLALRAASAPDHLPHLAAATEPPPTRHRRVGRITALTVVALVVGVAWITHETRTPPGEITYPKVTVPSTWRYESYAGVQVRVPDTWGWGGAPIHADFFRHGGLGSCGANQAAVGADASQSAYVSSATPFVGRPAVLTHRCISWGADGVMPSTDAVWFGSPLKVGLKGVGSVVAETRAVGDQHVTVFSADSKLRRQVLGSVETVDIDANGCPTRAVEHATAGPDRLRPSALSVCVYSQDTGVPVLLWSARVDADAARSYVAATGDASSADSADRCAATPQGQWVALGVADDGGVRWDVADLACSRIITADGSSAPFQRADLAPWALPGIRAYVAAPRSAAADVASYFRSATG